MISAHYGMSDVFDNLVISLCKFTTLLSSAEVRPAAPFFAIIDLVIFVGWILKIFILVVGE